MSDDLPAPLVAADVDVRDLDGFMLNVERLMASELVALSSHEVIGACVFLWCRAWKQLPAASLPDDDRVIMAFSRLPAPRYRRLKIEILRGFVKCRDGRLYHRVLAREATEAFGRKSAFRVKREKDAERLRNWRSKQDGNTNEIAGATVNETKFETDDETRFVAEGQGRDREGTGHKERKDAGPPLRDGIADDPHPAQLSVVSTPEADLYRRGKDILGTSAGGFVRKLLVAKNGDLALARAALEIASTKSDPREYVGGVINASTMSSRDLGGVRSSRDF